jgi:tetratricopeptide (TPR) repeat protein
MKSTNKLIIIIFTFLALAASAYAQTPREQLKQMVEQLQKTPNDNALREKIIKLAAGIKPAPMAPAEAERLDGRAQYAFKNAKSEADMLDAAREYLRAVEAAPWIADYYFNLCTILEKANRPAEAIRACKFYLIAAPAAQDAGDARKRVAGLEYAVERMSANMRSRDECIRYPDMYENGAKVANFGNLKISVKLISPMYGGVSRNQLQIRVIANGESPYGQRKNLDPVDETFRLEDRVDGTPWYRLTISRDGRVTFGSAGAAQAEIVTSIVELQQLRVDQMKSCAVAKKDGKYYVGLAQGGVPKSSVDGALVAGYLMFSSDCSGTLLGDKPGWLPELFVPYETTAGAQGFALVSASDCAQSAGGNLGWLTP